MLQRLFNFLRSYSLALFRLGFLILGAPGLLVHCFEKSKTYDREILVNSTSNPPYLKLPVNSNAQCVWSATCSKPVKFRCCLPKLAWIVSQTQKNMDTHSCNCTLPSPATWNWLLTFNSAPGPWGLNNPACCKHFLDHGL